MQLYRQRGKAYLKNKNWREATADYRKVLELGPYDREDRNSLNIALFELGKYDEVIEGKVFYFTHFTGD